VAVLIGEEGCRTVSCLKTKMLATGSTARLAGFLSVGCSEGISASSSGLEKIMVA
jgi:hypothetical protein